MNLVRYSLPYWGRVRKYFKLLWLILFFFFWLGLQTVIALLWIKSSQQLLRSNVFIIYLLYSHPVCPWLLYSLMSWGTRRKSKEGVLGWECKWGVQFLLISSLKCRTCKPNSYLSSQRCVCYTLMPLLVWQGEILRNTFNQLTFCQL